MASAMLLWAYVGLLLGASSPPTHDQPVTAPIGNQFVALKEKGRYRVRATYDETLEFYRRAFKAIGGVRWRSITNKPGLKAQHIESLRKKTNWEGINIYESNGEVKVYVLPRPPEPGTPAN